MSGSFGADGPGMDSMWIIGHRPAVFTLRCEVRGSGSTGLSSTDDGLRPAVHACPFKMLRCRLLEIKTFKNETTVLLCYSRPMLNHSNIWYYATLVANVLPTGNYNKQRLYNVHLQQYEPKLMTDALWLCVWLWVTECMWMYEITAHLV
jgi:hypothetical protein